MLSHAKKKRKKLKRNKNLRFNYLGKYLLKTDAYRRGLAIRRVGDSIRLIMMGNRPWYDISEWDITNKNFDDTLEDGDIVASWGTESMEVGSDRHVGLSWLPSINRLCILQSIDYPSKEYPVNAHFVELNEGEINVGDPKKISLKDRADRQCNSGIIEIPEGLKPFLNDYDYLVGFGGYHSRVGTFQASLGLTCFAIPNPVPYFKDSPPNPVPADDVGALISDYRILAVHDAYNRGVKKWHGYEFVQTGINTDYEKNIPWNEGMGGPVPSGYFKAIDKSGIIGPVNYFDGGDRRQNPGSDANPTGFPDFEPIKGNPPYYNFTIPLQYDVDHHSANTVFPWCWGDAYVGGFIEYGKKRGFIQIMKSGAGKMFYYRSSGAGDETSCSSCEAHIFDLDDLIAVSNGTKLPTQIQPMAIIPLMETLDYFGSFTYEKFNAAYDNVDKKLYIIANRGQSAPGIDNVRKFHIYVYSVD